MLADSLPLNPPIQYSIIWLIIGIVLVTGIILWFGVVYWLTRRRPLKSIEDLKGLPSDLDLEKLKLKYLQLIDECYQSYQNKQTSLRGLHRGLSMTVRFFVHEANHFPAPRLTLADLKRAPYPKLTRLIAEYYAEEFALIEHGDPIEAVETAKELVRQWV